MSRTKYTVLYPRKYTSQAGEQTHWMHIGVAFESPKGDGMDVILYLTPPPDSSGQFRLMIRKDDREGYYGPGEPRRGGQPEQQQRRPPQHRERQYGGAAAQQDVPMPGEDEDQIPF
jgi:hypothetical protein